MTTHCLYGVGVDTPDALRYTGKGPTWMDSQPTVVPGNGDGTVNLRSLQGCERRWGGGAQPQPVHAQSFNDTEHVAMLASQQVIQYVLGVAMTTS